MINHINPVNPINHGSDNCYNIIKAHHEELKVATKEGEGEEFIVELPTLARRSLNLCKRQWSSYALKSSRLNLSTLLFE